MMIGVVSVFMDIENDGKGPDEITAVSASVPKSIALLHDIQDGRMVVTNRIAVPAEGVTALKPGGIHIMLFNMPKDLKDGDIFTLGVTFAKSGQRQITVKVVTRQLGPEHPM